MTRTRDHGLLSDLASLLLCGLLAGVVIAAAAFPAVAVAGLAAKAGSDSFEHLPSELKTPPLPQTSTLRAADHSVITYFFGDENRTYVPLAKIPVQMQKAMLAAEDARFYDHKGVDIKGIIRAFIANQQAGEIQQGASTLTQQYVKLVLQQQAKNEQEREAASAPTNARKLREMRYAIALEQKYTKDEILERYLNIAFFGNRGYGVAQAASVYFSKPLAGLTLAESALLAGLVQSPTQYNPTRADKQPATERRNYVLSRMGELGYAPQPQVDAAAKTPIVLKPRQIQRSCGGVIGKPRQDYGFFCEYFLDWWSNNPEFGKSPEERLDKLERGGYQIRSSIDPRMQRIAQTATDREMRTHNTRIAGGIVMVEPGTGRVKAMAVNRTYALDQSRNPQHPLYAKQKANYPNTVLPLLSGSDRTSGYAAGSTFKVFALVAAIEAGLPLNTAIVSPHQYVTSKRDSSPGNCGGYYCPSNATRAMAGTHTMWSGFGESVNTFFIQLEEMVGLKAVVQTAQKMGIQFRGSKVGLNRSAEQTIRENNLPFVFGQASDTTPLEVATAYATLAARGKKCDPLAAVSIVGPDDKPVKGAEPKCRQVMPADVADAATDAARCPVGDPAAGRCSLNNGPTGRAAGALVDRPLAGKTGSTPGNKAVWMAGYTPNLAAASFVTNPDNPQRDNANAYQGVPKRIFGHSMQESLSQMPIKQFVPPTRARAFGVRVTMPDVDGDSIAGARATLEGAGFKVRVANGRVNSYFRAGLVAFTTPRGGGGAVKGGLVTLFVSNGEPPVQATTPSAPGVGPNPRQTRTSPNPRRTRPRFVVPTRPVTPPQPR